MVMTNDKPIFVDTNILVFANASQAPFHTPAVETIQRLWDVGTELWISRQILREYISTFTRPQQYMQSHPASAVISDVRSILARFHVANETSEITENLLDLLAEIPIGGKQIHDANIVATMQAYGIERLLTHNTADFARFSEHITLLPLETD